ncbi:MAG TPA: hypothetical protein VI585_14290 [Candidatus Binatia bacterium]
MEKRRRWEIALCDRGTVHLHYGTGSLHILKEDFLDLAGELQQLANRLAVVVETHRIQKKKGLLQ